MRFGTFSYSNSFDPQSDHQTIEDALREAELAEEIGLDAVWLTEHHFSGTASYADPVVFAAAVAMKTQRVSIGFAVVQIALHHPVRLAVQTALLDHLSNGRLIVGTGRGSSNNEYEYIGFGTTTEEGRQMLPEAEELLVKAWASENVRHEGRFWQVSFPILRPRPYQKPHPPLVRACLAEESLLEMAKMGRPILITIHPFDTLERRLQLYQDTMLEAGFDEPAVEQALNETWVQGSLYVAEGDEEAMEVAIAAQKRSRDNQNALRLKYNPVGVPSPKPSQAPPDGQGLGPNFPAGSPARVTAQIAALRDLGVRNLLTNFNVGQMPQEQVERSMRLFGEKVLPRFQSR